MKTITCIIVLITLIAGSCKSPVTSSGTEVGTIVPVDTTQTLSTIAFGSCNRIDLEQPLWEAVLAQNPDLWIWLGDNIYADTNNMAATESMYQQQLQQPGYQRLLARVPVIGTWDDHDYGINDGGKRFVQKEASRDLLLNFLHVPRSRAVWDHQGAYQSYTFGPEGQRVKIMLLDTRYFRDTLVLSAEAGKKYGPNPEGDILGEAQWQWLTQELTQSDAQVNIIGSSIQVIAQAHGYEKWANFPQSRQRLFDLIAEAQAPGVVLLSGDRHIGEISRLDLPNVPYPLYDITSSGLTHVYQAADEPNQYRVSPLVTSLNFGLIKIDWNENPVSVTYEIVGEKRKVFAEKQVRY